MERPGERASVVLDGHSRFCLTAICVLLTVLILGLWAEGPVGPSEGAAAPPARPAGGQFEGIGNPSSQRMAMVRGIQETNRKLDEILTLLKSGKVKVALAEGEGKHVPANPPRPAGE